MTDELSAASALMDDKVFQRDLAVVTVRFPSFSQYECLMITLAVHNHVLLAMWAPEEEKEDEKDDDPPGWKPPEENEWR